MSLINIHEASNIRQCPNSSIGTSGGQKLRMLSLCSGIGGADLAAEATGAIEVVGQVEIDPFCQAVLAKHWPQVKRISDIKEVAGHEFGDIDIIVGGFPCQPHSLAGKRKASEDERNLWPEIKRLLSAIKPRWFVAENVSGLLSSEAGRFYGTILADLDTLGYRVGWSVYGASEVGAPHKRERVFLVAYTSITGQRRIQSECQSKRGNQAWTQDDGQTEHLAHATSKGLSQWGPDRNHANATQIAPRMDAQLERCGTLAYTHGQRREECNTSTRGNESRFVARRTDTPTMADSHRTRGSLPLAGKQSAEQIIECSQSGQPQSSICGSTHGLPARLDQHRWPARPGEAQKVGEAPRTITEKIPYRNQRLKALGNSIVPQQIKPVFDAIVAVEREMERVA